MIGRSILTLADTNPGIRSLRGKKCEKEITVRPTVGLGNTF